MHQPLIPSSYALLRNIQPKATGPNLALAASVTPGATVSDVVTKALAFEAMLTSSQLSTL